jgi:hypothetical protein
MCEHKYVYLYSSKTHEYTGYNTHYTRTDTFFCEKCLVYKEVKQETYSRDTPSWFSAE